MTDLLRFAPPIHNALIAKGFKMLRPRQPWHGPRKYGPAINPDLELLTSPPHWLQLATQVEQPPKKRIELHDPHSQLGSAPPSRSPGNLQRREHTHTQAPEADWLTENDADIEETENEAQANEVVMAIDVSSKGAVGCCYYDAMEEKLMLLSEVSCGGLEVIETCKCAYLHIMPY